MGTMRRLGHVRWAQGPTNHSGLTWFVRAKPLLQNEILYRVIPALMGPNVGGVLRNPRTPIWEKWACIVKPVE